MQTTHRMVALISMAWVATSDALCSRNSECSNVVGRYGEKTTCCKHPDYPEYSPGCFVAKGYGNGGDCVVVPQTDPPPDGACTRDTQCSNYVGSYGEKTKCCKNAEMGSTDDKYAKYSFCFVSNTGNGATCDIPPKTDPPPDGACTRDTQCSNYVGANGAKTKCCKNAWMASTYDDEKYTKYSFCFVTKGYGNGAACVLDTTTVVTTSATTATTTTTVATTSSTTTTVATTATTTTTILTLTTVATTSTVTLDRTAPCRNGLVRSNRWCSEKSGGTYGPQNCNPVTRYDFAIEECQASCALRYPQNDYQCGEGSTTPKPATATTTTTATTNTVTVTTTTVVTTTPPTAYTTTTPTTPTTAAAAPATTAVATCDADACSSSVGKSMGCASAGKYYWNKYDSAAERAAKDSFYGCQGFAQCWNKVCGSRNCIYPLGRLSSLPQGLSDVCAAPTSIITTTTTVATTSTTLSTTTLSTTTQGTPSITTKATTQIMISTRTTEKTNTSTDSAIVGSTHVAVTPDLHRSWTTTTANTTAGGAERSVIDDPAPKLVGVIVIVVVLVVFLSVVLVVLVGKRKREQAYASFTREADTSVVNPVYEQMATPPSSESAEDDSQC